MYNHLYGLHMPYKNSLLQDTRYPESTLYMQMSVCGCAGVECVCVQNTYIRVFFMYVCVC